jgi:hypothetical protein
MRPLTSEITFFETLRVQPSGIFRAGTMPARDG